MALKNKTEFLIFRVTEEEKIKLKQLLQKHDYGSISKFFRHQIELLWKRPKPIKEVTRAERMENVAQLLSSEIWKVGININQIARRVNKAHDADEMGYYAEKILGHQKDIMWLLEAVIRNFEGYVSDDKNSPAIVPKPHQ